MEVMELRGIYRGLCINCGGRISDDLLLETGLCRSCLGGDVKVRGWGSLIRRLSKEGKLKSALDVYSFLKELREFSSFFKKALGYRMWALQESWARRIFLGRSFSIVAPTGVGKTMLGVVMALYLSLKGKRSYIVVPTGILVEQVTDRLMDLSRRLDLNMRIAHYHGSLSQSAKREELSRIESSEFDILVTTDRFIVNHYEELRSLRFNFVFIDDVDSFLKSPRNVDRILIILGFDEETVESALKILNLRREASRISKMGGDPSEVLESIEELRARIRKYKAENEVGLLVVSGATLKAKRTRRIRLFEELLDFQLGFKPELLRNIRDFYLEKEKSIEEHVAEIMREYGDGCLIFVPTALGREYAERIGKFLSDKGFRVHIYQGTKENILKDFVERRCAALIGIASFRSPLARGIDLPERVRYVIFAGVPRMEIPLSWDECNPTKLLALIRNIRGFLNEDERGRADEVILRLRRIVPLSSDVRARVESAIRNQTELEGFDEFVRRIILDARSFLKEAITPEVIERIKGSEEASIKREGDRFHLIVSDPVAYIQASGRASRMYAGGISRGASFLIVDDKKAFNSLRNRLRFMADVSWSRFTPRRVRRWLEKVDEDRRVIRELMEGKVSRRVRDYMKTALLIVESPTKARTISRFFGRPYKRKVDGVTVYEVSTGRFLLSIVASRGHIYDLTITDGFHGVENVDGRFIPVYDFIRRCLKCGEQFTEFDECPRCGSAEFRSQRELIEALRKLSLEVNKVFIATDPDTEGEKIAYDILCSLHPLNKEVERLEFHEITKKAFLQAIRDRRGVNERMVEAQIVRRVEDRWIGFELSRRLWKKFGSRTLSAGRAQSPVLRWIVERTTESRRRKPVLYAKLFNGVRISIENPTFNFPLREFGAMAKQIEAKIEGVEVEERIINPPPPYTTDTLLKDASSRLRLPSSKVMELAQDLFEMGLCTYHRTDSTTVSTVGINIAKSYIQERFPSNFTPRRYQTEGAHECIRPTRALDAERLRELRSLGILRFPKRLTEEHLKLYDMIFRRFIASQMSGVRVLHQRFRVRIRGNERVVER
ncbi:reverse gyrase [Candidatus Bathyarchaeota archaeon]|nr:MAG: reverse gyrase [Candidatus Bathyarchaeota archaeon]